MARKLTISIPELKTERLYLRAVTLEDSKCYEKNFSDYEVIQHLSHLVPWPFPVGGVKDFLQNTVMPELGNSRCFWVIFLKENKDEVIGGVDLWRDGKPENRGFWLAKKHWGKGFMTEALKPVTDFAFNQLGFEKLVFANAVGNNRSRRIKEKTGAVFLRNEPARFVNPEYKEHEVWELSKSNWQSLNNTRKKISNV